MGFIKMFSLLLIGVILLEIIVTSGTREKATSRQLRRRKKKDSHKFLSNYSADSFQHRLYKYLFGRGYNKAVRPVHHYSDQVVLNICMSLTRILDMNDREQVLEFSCFLRLHWHDDYLMWNSSEFGDLEKVRVPTSTIWLPDITIYNNMNAGATGTDVIPQILAIIKHDGSVSWLSPGHFHTACQIDVFLFPFDTQRCPVVFGSWTHDASAIDMFVCKDFDVNLGFFQPHTEFEMVRAGANRIYDVYPTGNYTSMEFFVVLRRRPTNYIVSLIMPCVLLLMLACFTFLLPPESGERISLSVTLVLSMIVSHQLIASELPPSAEVPLLGLIFGTSTFVLSLSTLISIFVIRIFFAGEFGWKVPKWMRKVFLVWLAKAMFLHKQTAQFEGDMDEKTREDAKKKKLVDARTKSPLPQRKLDKGYKFVQEPERNGVRDSPLAKIRGAAQSPQPDLLHRSDVSSLQREVRKIRQAIEQKLEEDDKSENIKSQWRMVAIVIDRFMFVIYITTMCLMSALAIRSFTSRHGHTE